MAEIFEHRGEQNPPTPYFLVYVNDSIKERLVNPVCREIAEMDTRPDETGQPVDEPMDVSPDKPTDDVVMEDPPAYRESVANPAGTNTHMTAADHSNSNSKSYAYVTSNPAVGGESNESPTNSSEKIQW